MRRAALLLAYGVVQVLKLLLDWAEDWLKDEIRGKPEEKDEG